MFFLSFRLRLGNLISKLEKYALGVSQVFAAAVQDFHSKIEVLHNP